MRFCSATFRFAPRKSGGFRELGGRPAPHFSGPEIVTQTNLCSSCHEEFASDADWTECPRCGAIRSRTAGAGFLDQTLLQQEFDAACAPREPRADSGNASATKAHEPDPLIGTDLDVYKITMLLGRGGMGKVYLAQHQDLHRFCALKILAPHLVNNDQDYVTRFQNEGRAAAALIHPNIVTVHAIGQARELHFLEMEFVAGRSLHNLIRSEGRLNPIRSTSLAARIAEGLAEAHRAGIIHRDLKPDNVLLTHQGVPKLADFGLAKRLSGHLSAAVPEGLMGTPNFMAPELFHGEPATPASDVYALGVTYFLMLTGNFPFRMQTLTMLMSAVVTEIAPNVREICPDIPLEMSECLSILMAKSPDNRPADGIEAAQLLHAILGQVRDLETLIVEAFKDDPHVGWTREGNRFRLDIALRDGRGQQVFVEPSEHPATERLLLIYSICCPADPAYYEFALRLNSDIPHGGLAIREIDGTPRFIMVDTYPRGTVDAEEIRRSVTEIAYRADAVEKLLTGMDRH